MSAAKAEWVAVLQQGEYASCPGLGLGGNTLSEEITVNLCNSGFDGCVKWWDIFADVSGMC